MQEAENKKRTYIIFIWHAAFLSLTMSMLDFNTVLPSLIYNLTESKIIFGLLYSVMLGTPLIFNIILSSFMHLHKYKKKILLLGIYIRSFSFLGMAAFIWFFGRQLPSLAIASFFFWIFLFSISGGFAGIAYSDIIGKSIEKRGRGKFFASKQFATSAFSFIGGIVILNIFTFNSIPFPKNYTITLITGFAGLIIASIAFWFIKEPPSILEDENKISFKIFIKKVPSILKKDTEFTRFIIVENMFSFTLMIFPFYMLYAKDTLVVNGAYVGYYLIIQTVGTIISNILWGLVSNKWGSKILVRICIIIGGLIPLLALLLIRFGPNFYSIIFFLVGFIISGRV
ncbi:MAG: MFS transporter, partial [Actinobacteria bacterium]|nr:MFS transporter [Actinomycetota bacterium]